MIYGRGRAYERVVDRPYGASKLNLEAAAARRGGALPQSLKIVVVEDEPLTRSSLVAFFTQQGHEVRPAGCVASCRATLANAAADVVLLDIGLPGEDGISYARELRDQVGCGVIMVSHEHLSTTRIEALDAGADDYVLKPVDFEELAARVRSVARRRSVTSAPVTIGAMTIDLEARSVMVDNAPVNLSRGEFDLLRTLIQAQGKIVAREALSAAVSRGEGDLRSVDALVSRMRRKLATVDGTTLIATVAGFGYRLATPRRAAD